MFHRDIHTTDTVKGKCDVYHPHPRQTASWEEQAELWLEE